MLKISYLKEGITLTALCFSTLMLQGCNQKIDSRETETTQGLIYKHNESDPFTGKLTNFPMSSLGASSRGNCEVDIKKGLIDGLASCKSPEGVKILELTYKEGTPTGLMQTWDRESGKLSKKIEFLNNRKNGLEEVYNPSLGKLISKIHWIDGKKSGEEKVWDITGETLLIDLNWENEKQTGFSKSGEREQNYKDGKLDGISKYYIWKGDSPAARQSMALDNIVKSLGGGTVFAGMVGTVNDYTIREEEYKDDVLVEKNSKSDVAEKTDDRIQKCVESKNNAFRKEKGEDAAISYDMTQEWENECAN